MSSLDMANIKGVKYFNNLNPTDKKEIPKDDLESLNEKVKLEFLLQNAKQELTYSINAKLLDREVSSYNSEEKKAHTNNEVAFEKFYVCDYFFEKEQKIQIIIKKNNTPITINTTLGCIVGSRNCTFVKKYDGNETLIIKSEKKGKNDTFIDIKFSMK